MNKQQAKKHIVDVAKMAFMKGYVAGWGGNISYRLSDDEILITPHKGSLGFLSEDSILSVSPEGKIIGDSDRRISTESKMHLALYNAFAYDAVIHLHPPCINSLVAAGVPLALSTYETALTLGETPPIIAQNGPTVTDIEPLLEAFQSQSIVILEKHGIVAAGDDLLEAFALADVAEEAAQLTLHSHILQGGNGKEASEEERSGTQALRVFSDEHLQTLRKLINADEEARKLGLDTDLTVRYAIKQAEDGKVYNMHFRQGELVTITNDEDADFINVGKRAIWIKVFNGRLDPFAATSQKKLRLVKGHIGDLSKWYAPFYRIFALWKFAPVLELDDE
jgi:L-fuculose-phosphate aldolase